MSDELIDTPQAEPANLSQTDNQPVDNVTEPANLSQTDNREDQTQASDVQTQQVVKQEAQPYTEEELRSIKDWKAADPERLAKTYEARDKSYKELQSEYTKVTQRQSVEQPKPQRPSDPRGAFAHDLFQAFDAGDYANVNALMGSLDLSIERRKLEMVKEFDPERQSVLEKSILDDIEFKTKLNNALSSAFQEQQLYGSLNQSVDAELFKQIPDFNKVAPEIGNFMMKDHNIGKDVIENMLDPKVYVKGLMEKHKISASKALELAKKIVIQGTKFAHDYYSQASGKGYQKKEIKQPPFVEGKGVKYGEEKKPIKLMNDKEVEAEIQRIKYS